LAASAGSGVIVLFAYIAFPLIDTSG